LLCVGQLHRGSEPTITVRKFLVVCVVHYVNRAFYYLNPSLERLTSKGIIHTVIVLDKAPVSAVWEI